MDTLTDPACGPADRKRIPVFSVIRSSTCFHEHSARYEAQKTALKSICNAGPSTASGRGVWAPPECAARDPEHRYAVTSAVAMTARSSSFPYAIPSFNLLTLDMFEPFISYSVEACSEERPSTGATQVIQCLSP